MVSVEGSTTPHISVVVGVTVGLLASFVQSLGLTLQRQSHLRNEALPFSLRKRDHKRPLWLVGFAVFISSNLLGTIFQIGALPIVVLGPLGAISLLYNAFFARIILGDEFTIHLVAGTFLIAGGAVLVGIFGVVPEETHSLDELVRLYSRPAFIIWISLLIFSLAVILTLAHFAEWALERKLHSALSLTSTAGAPGTPKIPNLLWRSNSGGSRGRRVSVSRHRLIKHDRDSSTARPSALSSIGATKSSPAAIQSLSAAKASTTDSSRSASVASLAQTSSSISRRGANVENGSVTGAASLSERPTRSARMEESESETIQKHQRRNLPPLSTTVKPDPPSPTNGPAKTTCQIGNAAIERNRLILGVAYGGASGTLSGLCLLFAKTGIELLILTVVGQNQFGRFEAWLIVLVLLIAAVLQLFYLNRALRLVGPTLICPLAFCFYNLSSIVSGLIYYNQWDDLSGLQIGLVGLGTAILLTGVWVVSIRNASGKEEMMGSENPEEAQGLMHFTEGDTDGRQSIGDEASDESDQELVEWIPRGLTIGIGAASPGFEIRPTAHRRLQPSHARHSTLPTSYSFPSLTDVSVENDIAAEESPLLNRVATETDVEEGAQELAHRTSQRRHRRGFSISGALYVGGRQNSVDLRHAQNGFVEPEDLSVVVDMPAGATNATVEPPIDSTL